MEEIQSTTKKNEKISLFANFLRQLSNNELPVVCYYASGRPFSRLSPQKIQFGGNTFFSVIKNITKHSSKELRSVYTQYADFGTLVEFALQNRKPQTQRLDTFFTKSQQLSSLAITAVHDFFTNLASLSGQGSTEQKKKGLVSILTRCTPLEGKYLARIITSDTRIGFREGLLLDAIAEAFGRDKGEVRYAFMILSDLGEVALHASDLGIDLTQIPPVPLHPLKSMLASKVDSAAEALKAYPLLIAQPKIDGFRAQLHLTANQTRIFSRNLEDITDAFPEITSDIPSLLINKHYPLILDGEIVALVDNKPVFFQDISTRILRKQGIDEMVKRLPCYFYTFDIILHQGHNLVQEPLERRIALLNSLPTSIHLKLVSSLSTNKLADIENFYHEMISAGYEGLMLKDPASTYLAGKRGKGWLKLKASLPTLDLVIIAAEWGHGRRTGWLSNYHLAARDGDSFSTIGKTFKGLTDKEFRVLTDSLNKIVISNEPYGVKVTPQIVVEVEFDNIQESTKYDSGMALRFARIKRIRTDKEIDEIDTLDTVKELFTKQLDRQRRMQ